MGFNPALLIGMAMVHWILLGAMSQDYLFCSGMPYSQVKNHGLLQVFLQNGDQ